MKTSSCKSIVVGSLLAALLGLASAQPAGADDYYAAYRAYLNAYRAYLDAYDRFYYGRPPGHYVPGYGTPGYAAPAYGSYAVKIQNFTFIPSAFRIRAGQTIVFTNYDNAAHTVTADNRSFDSGTIGAGANWTSTFRKPGIYPFHCSFHPHMRATLVVD